MTCTSLPRGQRMKKQSCRWTTLQASQRQVCQSSMCLSSKCADLDNHVISRILTGEHAKKKSEFNDALGRSWSCGVSTMNFILTRFPKTYSMETLQDISLKASPRIWRKLPLLKAMTADSWHVHFVTGHPQRSDRVSSSSRPGSASSVDPGPPGSKRHNEKNSPGISPWAFCS